MADRKRVSNFILEKFVPRSDWTDDLTSHYLRVVLPGFKTEEVTLEVDDWSFIIVRGERQASENKYIWFKESFKIPENSASKNITGRFEGGVMYVTVPKQVIEENEEHKNGVANIQNENVKEAPNEDNDLYKDDAKHGVKNRNPREGFDHKPSREDPRQEVGLLLRRVMKKLRRNKGIVITAILAFSLGVLVSHYFQSDG